MPDKSFEYTIRFLQVNTSVGQVSLPIVTVILYRPDGARARVPLIFDTGATVTTLRKDLFPMLGLSSWNVGTAEDVDTVGGTTQCYRYEDVTLEVFGKEIHCPVTLSETFPYHPLYAGLLGREGVFQEFGFGFWEGSKELYVTLQP